MKHFRYRGEKLPLYLVFLVLFVLLLLYQKPSWQQVLPFFRDSFP